jgi:hypothetical protein
LRSIRDVCRHRAECQTLRKWLIASTPKTPRDCAMRVAYSTLAEHCFIDFNTLWRYAMKTKALLMFVVALAALFPASGALAVYDAGTGRWLTRDHLGYIDSSNLYAMQ